MRGTLRLLAAVKPGRYLEAGAPTGLTGLKTHPNPRSRLLYLYGSTLEQLKEFPDSSVYKQSTEALTKHRMQIVEAVKPTGIEEWQKRAAEKIQQFPDRFKLNNPGRYSTKKSGGNTFVEFRPKEDDSRIDYVEWDGEVGSPLLEGPRTQQDGNFNAMASMREPPEREDPVQWEPEPSLEASQSVRFLGIIGGSEIGC